MKKTSSSLDTLNRAKSLLISPILSDLELVELSVLMNEYIDFLNEFKDHEFDLVYIEKEHRLREILNAYCDNIDVSIDNNNFKIK